MKQKYFVCIDVGSSFTKSSIYDTDGKSLGAAKRDTRPDQPEQGVAEYDPEMILNAVVESVRELVEKTAVSPDNIAAICLDGMQSGVLGIDVDGNPTTPYTTTLDIRFTPYLNRVLEHHHDLIRSITGSGQPTIAPKIMWIRDAFPDAYRRTAKFATISGYLLAKLAGLPVDDIFIDITYLWVTGLSDTQHYTWSDELCRAMNISPEKLPRIVNSSDIIGSLSPVFADAVGLLVGNTHCGRDGRSGCRVNRRRHHPPQPHGRQRRHLSLDRSLYQHLSARYEEPRRRNFAITNSWALEPVCLHHRRRADPSLVQRNLCLCRRNYLRKIREAKVICSSR